MTQIKNIRISDLLKNEDIIKTETLNKNGFTSRDINQLIKEGTLEKIKQGYYIGKDGYVSDITIAANLIPMGVLCLFSAAEYYGLTTVNPSKICIALPRGMKCPTLPSNLFVKIYYMTEHHFEAGIIDVAVNGAMVRIYDIEKTICDCFKYDGEVEKGIALEMLKSYITRGNCNIQKLLGYAKILGKKKIIYPYLEALI